MVAILGRGLAPDGALDLDPLGDVVTDPALRHVVWFTVWQAALSTVLTLAVALPGAYVLARYDFPGRRVVRALVTVPFVLPTVVVGSAFVALLGAGRAARRPRARPDRLARSCSPTCSSTTRSSCAPSAASGRTSTRARRKRRGCSARAGGARSVQVTLPALRPAIVGRGRDRVPLLVHVVRRDPHPRRPARRHARDRDLPPDRAAPQPAARGRAHDRAARRRRAAARARRAGSRDGSGSRSRLRAAAETARRPRTRRRARVRSPANLARDGAAARRCRSLVLVERSFAHTRRATASTSTARSARSHAGSTLFVAPVDAIANSLRFAVVATVHRGRRRRAARRSRSRRRAGAALDTRGVAAARRLGGHGRLRVPHRARRSRRSTCATSWWLVPIAQALVAIPFVVRVDDAGAPGDRPAPARGGGDARRVAARGCGARSTCRSSPAPCSSRPGSRSRSRSASSAPPCSSCGPTTPTLPVSIYRLLGQPGAAELRRGDGRERDPHGADRAGDPRHRALPRRHRWAASECV